MKKERRKRSKWVREQAVYIAIGGYPNFNALVLLRTRVAGLQRFFSQVGLVLFLVVCFQSFHWLSLLSCTHPMREHYQFIFDMFARSLALSLPVSLYTEAFAEPKKEY